MNRIKILFIFTLFFVGISAQNSNTEKEIKMYKITFPTLEEENLKPLVTICEAIFQSKLVTMESNPFAFYYRTPIVVTEEVISSKFQEHHYTYDFELKLVTNENKSD